jgi:hypothetical protein
LTARLASGLFVSALMRRTQAQGGHAILMARGDESAGAILIQLLEKGQFYGLFERVMALETGYSWQRVGPQVIDNIREIDDYLMRRQARDPDLWLIELDIANGERLIAEMSE